LHFLLNGPHQGDAAISPRGFNLLGLKVKYSQKSAAETRFVDPCKMLAQDVLSVRLFPASWVNWIAFPVELEPVPAMTGTRPSAASTATVTISACSPWFSVGASPVSARPPSRGTGLDLELAHPLECLQVKPIVLFKWRRECGCVAAQVRDGGSDG
jgi:hypothetical protein